jgi:hypothetical protein
MIDAAVAAAQRWEFAPARIGERSVPSEMILHFRFAPPALAYRDK